MENRYLKGELTPEEIVYLTKIIKFGRNNFIENNKKNDFQYVELDEEKLVEEEKVEDIVSKKLNVVINVESLGKDFENVILAKIINKVLTNKEKLVLFYFFYEEKTTVEIAKKLGLTQSRISHIKQDSLNKILKKYKELGGK